MTLKQSLPSRREELIAEPVSEVGSDVAVEADVLRFRRNKLAMIGLLASSSCTASWLLAPFLSPNDYRLPGPELCLRAADAHRLSDCAGQFQPAPPCRRHQDRSGPGGLQVRLRPRRYDGLSPSGCSIKGDPYKSARLYQAPTYTSLGSRLRPTRFLPFGRRSLWAAT